MTSPVYGVIFNSDDSDPRPSQPSDLSVIGLVLPSDDANALAFPLNIPVAFDTGDPAILPLLGTGPLANAVFAIDDQLADLQVSARCVAVRVPTGADINGTIDNIVGDRASATGIYALLSSGSRLGVIPRLIGAPGYTGTTTLAVNSAVVTGGANAGGSKYADAAVVFAPTGPGITPATAHATIANGQVTSVVIDTPGNYPAGTTVSAIVTSNTGSGATVSLVTSALANPIVAALPEVLSSLLAHAVVGGPGTGEADAIAWRQTIISRRLIPVDNWNIVAQTTSNPDGSTTEVNVFEDGAARVLGLGARTDFKNGGYPFKSFAGQPVQNILGLKNYYTFSLTDGATMGQELMAAHIGVTERGEVGSETAVASSGFVFVGTFNGDTDPIWWFYNKSRGRDYAHLSLLKSIRLRLGVDNITPHSVQAVLNDMIAVGQDILSHEGSIGFKVGFDASVNSPNDLRQGKFRVSFNSEEPAPIMQVTVDSRPFYNALTVELATLVSQAATLVPQYITAT